MSIRGSSIEFPIKQRVHSNSQKWNIRAHSCVSVAKIPGLMTHDMIERQSSPIMRMSIAFRQRSFLEERMNNIISVNLCEFVANVCLLDCNGLQHG